MRCGCCPLFNGEDVCPEAEGKYGIEHADGELGCKHPRNWAEKRNVEYCNSLGEMGIDMGIEMSLSESELNSAVSICKHMIGLDHSKPYHRHGKSFYKPYRNYYEAPKCGNEILDKLPKFLLRREVGGLSAWYALTSEGLKWLGRQLRLVIKEREKND